MGQLASDLEVYSSLYLLKQVLRVSWLVLEALRQDHSEFIRCIRPQSSLDDSCIGADRATSVDMIPLMEVSVQVLQLDHEAKVTECKLP